jgi:hypothetical protein
MQGHKSSFLVSFSKIYDMKHAYPPYTEFLDARAFHFSSSIMPILMAVQDRQPAIAC